MKVIHIVGHSLKNKSLEEAINEAIKDKKVIDIKYSSYVLSGDTWDFDDYSALIMYEDCDNKLTEENKNGTDTV